MTHHPGTPAYHAHERFNRQRIHAVAVYCSDGRYGEQCDEFLQDSLGLPRYDRLAAPGGPACFAGHFAVQEEAALESVRFLVEVHGLERAILIAHQSCAFYTHMLRAPLDGLRDRQEEDLRRAARRILAMYPTLKVDLYFAHLEADASVTFDPVPAAITTGTIRSL